MRLRHGGKGRCETAVLVQVYNLCFFHWLVRISKPSAPGSFIFISEFQFLSPASFSGYPHPHPHTHTPTDPIPLTQTHIFPLIPTRGSLLVQERTITLTSHASARTAIKRPTRLTKRQSYNVYSRWATDPDYYLRRWPGSRHPTWIYLSR